MNYADWRSSFKKHHADLSPVCCAQLWNLEHETRIADCLKTVQQQIASEYTQQLAAGLPEDRAALAAFDLSRGAWNKIDCEHLGSIRHTAAVLTEKRVFTHVSWNTLSRLALPNAPGRVPPIKLSLPTPYKCVKSGSGYQPRVRFIWVTFADAEGKCVCSDNPQQIRKELGLTHITEDEVLYRIEIAPREEQHFFTPTCIDAGCYEAWIPPPIDQPYPWGLTRDCENGDYCWPEMLVEVTDHMTDRLVATKVSGPNGPLHPDYMVKR